MMTHNGATLAAAITEMSISDTWEEAKFEWELEDVYKSREPEACLCGHSPIHELCYIRNKFNDNLALVGNVCVTKFLDFPSNGIFQSINRVIKDSTRALGPAAIHHAGEKGWISAWEYNFYLDTCKRRRLSWRQAAKRVEINQVIIKAINSPKVGEMETSYNEQ